MKTGTKWLARIAACATFCTVFTCGLLMITIPEREKQLKPVELEGGILPEENLEMTGEVKSTESETVISDPSSSARVVKAAVYTIQAPSDAETEAYAVEETGNEYVNNNVAETAPELAADTVPEEPADALADASADEPVWQIPEVQFSGTTAAADETAGTIVMAGSGTEQIPETAAQDAAQAESLTETWTEAPATPEESAVQAPATEEVYIPETTPAPALTGIEAFYISPAQKREGDVVERAEICVYLYYSDGTTVPLTEGFESDRIGMLLHAGEEVIPVSYAGFTSNIVLPVASAPVPETAAPVQTPAAPETVPETAPVEAPAPQTQPAPAETAPAPPAAAASVPNVSLSGELTAYTLNLCQQYGVDSSVIFSVMYQESRFNPNAVSHSGAIGLMQVIQRYSQDRMNRLGVSDLFDPASNILVGIDILADYYYRNGNWTAALTEYRYGSPYASTDYASLILGRTYMFQ